MNDRTRAVAKPAGRGAILLAAGAALAPLVLACGAEPSPETAHGSEGSGGGANDSVAADVEFCRGELERAALHLEGFRDAYTDPARIPRSASGGKVRLVGPRDWTSGFPAGSSWLLYEFTGDRAWRDAAQARTAALRDQRTRTDTHDLGFVINDSFGQGLRLTGNQDYRTVLLDAAESLSSRFDEDVGATRSWDFGSWSFPVIIDNMMNLELLFDATELGGSEKFREMAISHARTSHQHHFRDDSSSYHVVDYDPDDGAALAKQTRQGLNDESAWARGQAWGLYGFTLCYRETEEREFLERAESIANFYTQSPVMPEDGVPYFDFDAPGLEDVPDHRDASAAAIATSALLELERYADADAQQRYHAFALKTLRTLSSPAYRAAPGANAHFLLEHSVGNYPRADEIDVAINYADYYYLEALLRCTRLGE